MRKPSFSVKTGLFLICLVLSLSALGAKGAQEIKGPALDPVTSYVDSIGSLIELDAIPDRIVSMGPNVTETIFALGAGDTLVGRTDYCDYPQQSAGITSIGTLWQPSIETILSLDPDLIVASSLANDDVLQALRKTGIPTAIINKQGSLEGTYDLIEDIALLVGRQEEGKALVQSMKDQVQSVKAAVAGRPTPTMYYVIDFGQFDSTATGDTYINEMIEIAGGSNVAKDGSYWTYSKEALIEKDPSLIILTPHWGSDFDSTLKLFEGTSGYDSLTAVKTKNVYPIDNDAVDRQGPRTAYAIEAFARIFHPQAF